MSDTPESLVNCCSDDMISLFFTSMLAIIDERDEVGEMGGVAVQKLDDGDEILVSVVVLGTEPIIEINTVSFELFEIWKTDRYHGVFLDWIHACC